MKAILYAVLGAVAALAAGCARSNADAHRVVVTLPALESIVTDLAAGTSIHVVKLIPDDISLPEIDQYLDDNEYVLDSAARCDAVVDVRSVVAEDATYGELRRRNIRIVEIDCATPADPDIAPVPVIKSKKTPVPYIWLSASNCMKMAEIASKDLEKLYPADSAALRANLKSLKSRYLGLMSAYGSRFASIADFQAATLSSDFEYFIKEVDLFVAFRFPPDEAFWPETLARDFKTAVRKGLIRTVVHRWKPSGPIGSLLDSCKVRTAVLTTGDPAMKSFDKGLYGLLEKNYKALLGAFEP